MDAANHINLWLQHRVPGSGLDAEGWAALRRDDDTLIIIHVPEGVPVCHLCAPVAPLPEDDREAALLAALQLNLMGRALGGCWLAWDDDLQMLVLCWNLHVASSDEVAFNNAIDNFTVALDAARSELMAQPMAALPANLVVA